MFSALAELPPGFWLVLAGLFGLAIGSFLNVVTHRLPLGLSVALPASHCPHCQTPLGWRDNLPVLSYLLLRGRCRACQAPISAQYPLIELLTATIFVALVWRNGASVFVIGKCAFAAVMITLAVIDARHHWLPDLLNFPTCLLGLLVSALAGGWANPIEPQIDVNLAMFLPPSDYVKWQAALFGALIFAATIPALSLLDWLDDLLFARYFDDEAESDTAPTSDDSVQPLTTANDPVPFSEISDESASQPATSEFEFDEAEWEAISNRRSAQRQRILNWTFVLGLGLAGGWALLLGLGTQAARFTHERAYHGLLQGMYGALVGAGLIWVVRASYFLLRRAEGMGLGDVKMMAAIGALLGWWSAFGVLLWGSIIGAIVGVGAALSQRNGLRNPLPFGTCLAVAALLILLRT